jgi:hypothetical protein
LVTVTIIAPDGRSRSARIEVEAGRALVRNERGRCWGGLPRGDFYRVAQRSEAKAADDDPKEYDQRKLQIRMASSKVFEHPVSAIPNVTPIRLPLPPSWGKTGDERMTNS